MSNDQMTSASVIPVSFVGDRPSFSLSRKPMSTAKSTARLLT
jgi:hypothetical protein